jgi:hypothetical protein
MAEEYYWAITETAERSCCGQSGSGELAFGFQFDCFIQYTYTVDHTYTHLRFAQNSPCAGSSGMQLLRKSGSVRTRSESSRRRAVGHRGLGKTQLRLDTVSASETRDPTDEKCLRPTGH